MPQHVYCPLQVAHARMLVQLTDRTVSTRVRHRYLNKAILSPSVTDGLWHCSKSVLCQ